jgi:hypothetical protein
LLDRGEREHVAVLVTRLNKKESVRPNIINSRHVSANLSYSTIVKTWRLALFMLRFLLQQSHTQLHGSGSAKC